MAHLEAAACTVVAVAAVAVVGHHRTDSAPLFHMVAAAVVDFAENHNTNCLEVAAALPHTAVAVGRSPDWVEVAALHIEKVEAAAVHNAIEEAVAVVASAVLVAEPGTA